METLSVHVQPSSSSPPRPGLSPSLAPELSYLRCQEGPGEDENISTCTSGSRERDAAEDDVRRETSSGHISFSVNRILKPEVRRRWDNAPTYLDEPATEEDADSNSPPPHQFDESSSSLGKLEPCTSLSMFQQTSVDSNSSALGLPCEVRPSFWWINLKETFEKEKSSFDEHFCRYTQLATRLCSQIPNPLTRNLCPPRPQAANTNEELVNARFHLNALADFQSNTLLRQASLHHSTLPQPFLSACPSLDLFRANRLPGVFAHGSPQSIFSSNSTSGTFQLSMHPSVFQQSLHGTVGLERGQPHNCPTLHNSSIPSPAPPRRKKSWSRAVFTGLQRRGLELSFQQQRYITKPDRWQLAAALGLTDAQVKVWFQNRRMKWRQEQLTEGKNMQGASEDRLVTYEGGREDELGRQGGVLSQWRGRRDCKDGRTNVRDAIVDGNVCDVMIDGNVHDDIVDGSVCDVMADGNEVEISKAPWEADDVTQRQWDGKVFNKCKESDGSFRDAEEISGNYLWPRPHFEHEESEMKECEQSLQLNQPKEVNVKLTNYHHSKLNTSRANSFSNSATPPKEPSFWSQSVE